MKRKRILKEASSKIEVAISKALNRATMHLSEVEELLPVTTHELISEHGLDYLLAEKVKTHVHYERQRLLNQSLNTWEVESRETDGSFTRTYPMHESRTLLENLSDLPDFLPEDEVGSSGRMLDYGHQKSDSNEGRMIRQALYEMAQYSQELHDLLEDNDDLPQWCHYKIATARSGLGKVKHYLEYKLVREES